MNLGNRGFTLIELMIALAIVGLLAAFGIPAYRDYVLRGNTVAAINSVATLRAQMEQYYQDNRTYEAANGYTPPCATVTTVTDSSHTTIFNVSCNGTGGLSAGAYKIIATGANQMTGFSYTVDQTNSQTSTVGARWGGGSYQCWITKRGQTC